MCDIVICLHVDIQGVLKDATNTPTTPISSDTQSTPTPSGSAASQILSTPRRGCDDSDVFLTKESFAQYLAEHPVCGASDFEIAQMKCTLQVEISKAVERLVILIALIARFFNRALTR